MFHKIWTRSNVDHLDIISASQQIPPCQEGHGGEVERREFPQVGLQQAGGNSHGGGGQQEI